MLALRSWTGGFVSAGADGIVHVLDAEGAPLTRHRLRRAGFLWGLAAVPGSDREWLVAGEGGRVHRLVFDGQRLHEAARLPLGAPVRSLAAGADGEVWAGLSDGRIVQVAGQRSSAPGWLAHRGPVIALTQVGAHSLVSGGEDGQVLCWDLRRARATHPPTPKRLALRKDFITRLLPVGDRQVLAAGYDGDLILSALGARSTAAGVSGRAAPFPHPP